MRPPSRWRKPPGAFAYEPTYRPTIPPGLTVSDWRAPRRAAASRR
jgi:hypothetical protein